MMVDRKGAAAAAILLVNCLAPAEAWAYLDPGTGSILLQALIATIAATAIAARSRWRQVRRFLRTLLTVARAARHRRICTEVRSDGAQDATAQGRYLSPLRSGCVSRCARAPGAGRRHGRHHGFRQNVVSLSVQ